MVGGTAIVKFELTPHHKKFKWFTVGGYPHKYFKWGRQNNKNCMKSPKFRKKEKKRLITKWNFKDLMTQSLVNYIDTSLYYCM